MYIAYEAGDHGLNVMMYNGESWATIGTNLSDGGDAVDTSFLIDPVNHYLYIAYVDKFSNSSITAKKYNGEQWIVVDKADFVSHASEVTAAWDSKRNSVVYAFPVTTEGNLAKVMRSTPQADSTQSNVLSDISHSLTNIYNDFLKKDL